MTNTYTFSGNYTWKRNQVLLIIEERRFYLLPNQLSIQ